ncbi:MAG: ABC transporter permease subunit [Phycisphaerales bacterium]|nr:ABC transporter permease subunit [Phycisphaerales bacterium]
MSLWKQFLRQTWWIAAGYFIILEAALVAAILYWPRFRDNMPAIIKLVPFDAIQDLLKAMEHAGYWPYLAVQQWFKGCSLFGVAAIAFIGSGIIARESDQRTAEFLLSRPVSRRRVLLVRHMMLTLLITIPVFLSSISAIWISRSVGEYIGWGEVLASSLYMSLFLWTLVSFTTLISVWSVHQLTAGAAVVGVVLVSFAMYLVEGINHLSPFALIDVRIFMSIHDGDFPWWIAGGFIIASMAMLHCADRGFARRDY